MHLTEQDGPSAGQTGSLEFFTSFDTWSALPFDAQDGVSAHSIVELKRSSQQPDLLPVEDDISVLPSLSTQIMATFVFYYFKITLDREHVRTTVRSMQGPIYTYTYDIYVSPWLYAWTLYICIDTRSRARTHSV